MEDPNELIKLRVANKKMAQVLRQLLRNNENYIQRSPEFDRALAELEPFIDFSEEEKQEALLNLATAVTKMNAGFEEALKIAKEYKLDFSIDFVELNYGGNLTYQGSWDGWNSSTVNNPC